MKKRIFQIITKEGGVKVGPEHDDLAMTVAWGNKFLTKPDEEYLIQTKSDNVSFAIVNAAAKRGEVLTDLNAFQQKPSEVKMAAINSKMVLMVPQSNAIEVAQQFKTPIDLGLCDLVLIPDESFDAAVQALGDVGVSRLVIRKDDQWVPVKKSNSVVTKD